MKRQISEKRQQEIDKIRNAELKTGDLVWVNSFAISNHKSIHAVHCKVVDVKGNEVLVVRTDNSVHKGTKLIPKSEIKDRDVTHVGANPFDLRNDTVRPVAFSFDSIIHGLDILGDRSDFSIRDTFTIGGIKTKEANWNPFIYNKKGQKEFYQRPFVWSINEKQLLIQSIYQGIDCGKILVRKRGWNALEKMAAKGETELAFNDIVDGKQRLDAVRGFIQLEYTDLNGDYFSDLSMKAQNRFTSHQLFLYAEMGEDTTDEEVLHQFLKLNFTGIPQSKEHIEFVQSLHNKIK